MGGDRGIGVVLLALLVGGAAAAQSNAPSSSDSLDELLGPSTPDKGNAAPGAPSQNEAPAAQQPAAGTPAGSTPETQNESVPVAGNKSDASPKGQGSARPTSRMIEEIVVTAQKREESLADVPLSVQAFSADVLDVKGVIDATDLPSITPGLTVTQQVGYVSTFIRGIGSDSFLLGDPSVANYVDGIYLPFSNGAAQDFGAVDRIEVLKGPQGTLFGRNAIGGAINVITRSPSLDASEVSLQSSYAGYDDLRNRLYLSAPIGKTLAVSLSGVYNEAEDYRKGTQDYGEQLPHPRAKAARGKLYWKPADWFDLKLTYLGQKTDGAGTNYSVNIAPSLLGRLAGIQAEDPYAGANNEPIFFHYNNRHYYGVSSLYLPWLDLKLSGSRQRLRTFADYDFDGSAQPLARFDVAPIQADVRSVELQLISNNGTPFASWFTWTAGAYYFKEPAGISHGVLSAASTNLADGIVLGTALPPALVSAISALDAAPIPSGTFQFVGLLDTRSVSGYGQGTIKFLDWLSLTLGGRYSEEKRTLIQSSSALSNLDGSGTTIQSYGGESDTTKGFKPKISLELRPLDGLLTYASFQQAEKSSTYNTISIYTAPQYVRPEKIIADEIGAKVTGLLGGAMSINAAVFQYRLTDAQVQFVSLLKGGAVTFENAASERVRGVDFDGLLQILPQYIDGLVLTAGAALLDPIYTSYPNGSGFDPNTGLLTQNNNFSGHQIVRSPRFSGDVGLSQTFNLSHGTIELGVDYYQTSHFYYLAENYPADEEHGYGTLNVRTSYLYEPWGLRLTGFGRNVTNTRYNYSKFIADFGSNAAAAPKATFGLRLNWDFK